MSDILPEFLGQNLEFVETLYMQFVEDPDSVPAEWKEYFERWTDHGELAQGLYAREARDNSVFRPSSIETNTAGQTMQSAIMQERLDRLVRAYRVRGHMVAKLDPLGFPRAGHPELEPSYYGFTEADLDQEFSAANLSGPPVLSLRKILERLRTTYCGKLGLQFMHIDDLRTKNWLQTYAESSLNKVSMTRDTQLQVLSKLTDAELFEQFIHKKFLGAKRFSLEGGETLIPLVDLALDAAALDGIGEAVIGMAHRGRLNILANVMGKPAAQIFYEFNDVDGTRHLGRGDVKYHLGFSSDHETSSGKMIHLSLCFNPSHLEFVGPVLVGRVRAKQDRVLDKNRTKVLPILIHGDAAFAGQGVVAETLNMSELPGYGVGGTLHIIVNNQIGFTTSPEYSRSSPYPSDVAKLLQIPIIHVNGEDPEAVTQAIKLAMEFRREFQKDVVIDLWCYRLYGHNEGDDPAFTQPVLYSAIRRRKTVREAYLDNLLKLGSVSKEDAKEIVDTSLASLNVALKEAASDDFVYREDKNRGLWAAYTGGSMRDLPEALTGVAKSRLKKLLLAQTKVPTDFTAHSKINRLFGIREQMAKGKRPLDWGAAEALAFASLLADGTGIRLSGQDSGRGTFSHRHSVLSDFEDGTVYIPLNNLGVDQASFEVIDSPLSEAAVLGFEFGYSLDMPESLVIWEAQFGDFANGAQVIIDQFIASSEEKWARLSGLVLMLPHGFEGQGPEHSSARLERFLGLCADDNMVVCNLTTPAQLFHCLRRHVIRDVRKPLIIMSPKSLLRHPKATSSLDELSSEPFKVLILDPADPNPDAVERVILCSGKIYYELAAERDARGLENVAIHRLEQIYPLRDETWVDLMKPYREGTEVTWVQEEPKNMGAWPHLRLRFGESICNGQFPFAAVTRPSSASPATGSAASHKIEQALVIDQAFDVQKTQAAKKRAAKGEK
ncbi:MAG: 2-oxoglutarate dehydrogenase E1 component [Myxococcales bacterium]|mgnify:CR=1 FL=1|nr:2-oxoglutarate dehydrogenase E1 component [Myxococcales bacterium]